MNPFKQRQKDSAERKERQGGGKRKTDSVNTGEEVENEKTT